MVRTSEEDDERKKETYQQARECLWRSLANLIGASSEVKIPIREGIFVSLRRGEQDLELSFSHEMREGKQIPQSTRMYDYYFPEKEPYENPVEYEGRRLQALDELVDQLLSAKPIERVP